MFTSSQTVPPGLRGHFFIVRTRMRASAGVCVCVDLLSINMQLEGLANFER